MLEDGHRWWFGRRYRSVIGVAVMRLGRADLLAQHGAAPIVGNFDVAPLAGTGTVRRHTAVLGAMPIVGLKGCCRHAQRQADYGSCAKSLHHCVFPPGPPVTPRLEIRLIDDGGDVGVQPKHGCARPSGRVVRA